MFLSCASGFDNIWKTWALGDSQWFNFLSGNHSFCDSVAEQSTIMPGPGHKGSSSRILVFLLYWYIQVPPGGGRDNALQYFCLENPMDKRAWWAIVHRVTKSWIQLKLRSMHTSRFQWYIWTIALCFTILFNATLIYSWHCFTFKGCLQSLVPYVA